MAHVLGAVGRIAETVLLAPVVHAGQSSERWARQAELIAVGIKKSIR